MYLKYFQIVNYKNLKSGKLVFGKGANTIIGENDAGKTNAINGMRMLLDDSFYYSSKRLKESDFSYALGNWRGHWIILSAIFDEMSKESTDSEIGAEVQVNDENEDFLKAYVKSGNTNLGIVTLCIRPKKSIRKKLFEAKTSEEFDAIRGDIVTSDYEFYYTSRAQTDFSNEGIYKQIVGDIENHKYANPEEDDASILGNKLDIVGLWEHISVVFIDALRDVEAELHKAKNPIRRIIENLENQIDKDDMKKIQTEIEQLNLAVSQVKEINEIGKRMNVKLNDMVGEVYSPELILESKLNDDITSLAGFLSLRPSNQDNIDLLGLGHMNMIYMALKIVEFEMNKKHELLNIMIVEEPEAHIHMHIQKTLFDKFNNNTDYTQVIMTTHSTHLSEASQIKSVNVFKAVNCQTKIMQPITGLDEFGKKQLELKKLKLSECIERYLDAKRTVLLFSKGVILVEGDGEEILIPEMVKKAFGITLDEFGIGVINIGSTAFEYIASIFSEERIQRYCSIITDLDVQAVPKDSTYYKSGAEENGAIRKEKLSKLYSSNPWVSTHYAPNTFEVDFVKNVENQEIIKRMVENYYVDKKTIKDYKENISGSDQTRALAALTLAKNIGKGWYATLVSKELDGTVMIPDYILEAIAFSSREMLTNTMSIKMAYYSLNLYEESITKKKLLEQYNSINTIDDKDKFLMEFTKEYKEDVVTKFLNIIDFNEMLGW